MKRGPHFKGGITDFRKVEDDLRRLLGDTDAALITTMIDYYGQEIRDGFSTPEDIDDDPLTAPSAR
ncbi:MAG TPA: hypothetical protein VJ692_07475, partial [Nitrospiraceae bacterium]|nr:hypothetical protein [Nitrospiraceae bacterium]